MRLEPHVTLDLLRTITVLSYNITLIKELVGEIQIDVISRSQKLVFSSFFKPAVIITKL